jgi:hypothetical protein
MVLDIPTLHVLTVLALVGTGTSIWAIAVRGPSHIAPGGAHEPPWGRQTGRPCAFDGKAVQARKAANESAARAESAAAPCYLLRSITRAPWRSSIGSSGYMRAAAR